MNCPMARAADPAAAPARWPTLGLGCARIGSFGNPATLAESEALVRAAMDMGVTLFDTANIYGQGDSERVIGRALAGRRDQAQIVTKAGQRFSAKMRLLAPFKPLVRALLARRGAGGAAVTAKREGAVETDWRPGALLASLDASLKRLGTDHVDGFLLHSPPVDILADETMNALLARVISSGRAARAGVSCDDMDALRAALALPETGLVELPWPLIGEAATAGLDKDIRARGIAVLARGVLAERGDLPPGAAIRRALASPIVTTVLVGTGGTGHLREAAEAAQ